MSHEARIRKPSDKIGSWEGSIRARPLTPVLTLFAWIWAMTPGAFAGPVPLSQGFTYQGRFFTPDGTQPMTDTVTFTISVYSGAGSCLLYQEQDANVNLQTTQGLYSITVGSAVGDPKRTSQDPGLTLAQIFSNNGQVIGNTANCPGGYTPASSEGRRLHVSIQSVTNGTTETLSPDLALGPVPQATVAETLQGLNPSELIQVNVGANLSQVTAQTLTNSSDASSLHNHDSLYVKLGTGGSQNIGGGAFYTSGTLGVGTNAAPSATEVQIDAASAATKGLVIQGYTGQSVNLFEVDNNSGSPLVTIDKSGNLALASNATLGLGTFASAPGSCSMAGQIWYAAGQVQYCNATLQIQTLGVTGAGVTTLNTLTAASQTLTTGTSGTAPKISAFPVLGWTRAGRGSDSSRGRRPGKNHLEQSAGKTAEVRVLGHPRQKKGGRLRWRSRWPTRPVLSRVIE